jgi:hypothetical protein
MRAFRRLEQATGGALTEETPMTKKVMVIVAVSTLVGPLRAAAQTDYSAGYFLENHLSIWPLARSLRSTCDGPDRSFACARQLTAVGVGASWEIGLLNATTLRLEFSTAHGSAADSRYRLLVISGGVRQLVGHGVWLMCLYDSPFPDIEMEGHRAAQAGAIGGASFWLGFERPIPQTWSPFEYHTRVAAGYSHLRMRDVRSSNFDLGTLTLSGLSARLEVSVGIVRR